MAATFASVNLSEGLEELPKVQTVPARLSPCAACHTRPSVTVTHDETYVCTGSEQQGGNPAFKGSRRGW